MRSRIAILIASAAVFLAFVGMNPEDLRTPDAATAAPAAAPAAERAATDPVPGLLGEPVAKSSTASAIDEAVAALAGHVRETSHPEALRYAFRAYYNYRAKHPDQVRKPYLYFIDMGLSNAKPRGYVFDMESLRVVEGPFTVAHGSGSGGGYVGVPTRFLNRKGSNASSLGLYLAQETYNFSGHSGGRVYRSIGLRLKGLSGSFNDAARARGIVVHGAPYVTAARAGRSEGCPAMPLKLARELIPMLANGGLVFEFSPHDARWMREDPWAGSLASAD